MKRRNILAALLAMFMLSPLLIGLPILLGARLQATSPDALDRFRQHYPGADCYRVTWLGDVGAADRPHFCTHTEWSGNAMAVATFGQGSASLPHVLIALEYAPHGEHYALADAQHAAAMEAAVQ